jgi:hypothetical protein
MHRLIKTSMHRPIITMLSWWYADAKISGPRTYSSCVSSVGGGPDSRVRVLRIYHWLYIAVVSKLYGLQNRKYIRHSKRVIFILTNKIKKILPFFLYTISQGVLIPRFNRTPIMCAPVIIILSFIVLPKWQKFELNRVHIMLIILYHCVEILLMYDMFKLSGYWWGHILMEIKLAHNTLEVIWLNHPNKK